MLTRRSRSRSLPALAAAATAACLLAALPDAHASDGVLSLDAGCLANPRACIAKADASAPPAVERSDDRTKTGSAEGVGNVLVLRLPAAEDAATEAGAEEVIPSPEFSESTTPDDWQVDADPDVETEIAIAPTAPATISATSNTGSKSGNNTMNRSRCIETSVRAGHGLDESSRVCSAVFPKAPQ